MKNGTFFGNLIHPRIAPCVALSYQIHLHFLMPIAAFNASLVHALRTERK